MKSVAKVTAFSAKKATKEPEKEPSFLEKMSGAWSGGSSLIAGDLPRLAKRTEIYVNGQRAFEPNQAAYPYCAVVGVIQCIMENSIHLTTLPEDEREELLKNNRAIFDEEKTQTPKEMKLATAALLEKINPPEDVMLILSGFAQTLVYQPSFEIIHRLNDGNILKDVRGADGWSIEVRIREDTVQVYHRKKQQSVAPENSPEHVILRWELVLTFERNMQRMTSATLNLIGLELSPNMPEDNQKLWKAKLCEGNLRVI